MAAPVRAAFPTSYDAILARIDAVDPIAYARTRNYTDGAVTYLSPYISRGVVSTRLVLGRILARGYKPSNIEKFIQELAWRDYWQQMWNAHGDAINQDLRRQQPGAERSGIPIALLEAQTGIEAIDTAIRAFYETGYLHNHLRMYIAALACNNGRCHWPVPARWMYYHLLDGDWASNALSWQWVSGANSGKTYLANQENINRYCGTTQRGTFLDRSYEEITAMPVPEALREVRTPELRTKLPETPAITASTDRPTAVYSYYNLDPVWMQDENVNRVLLLEPEMFTRYPVSPNALGFALKLAAGVPGLQVFTGTFDELEAQLPGSALHFKEHPLCRHWRGHAHPREWLSDVSGAYASFFGFWKKVQKANGW